MIFADPPYFLSNGGISVQSGKVVCVDKGEWDKGGTREYVDSFNRAWIKECREKLRDCFELIKEKCYGHYKYIPNAFKT